MSDAVAIVELNPELISSGFTVDGRLLGNEQAFFEQTLAPGRPTAIVCGQMQRLDLRIAFTALTGNDDHVRYCRDMLAAEGVDIGGLHTHPGLATGLTMPLFFPTDRMLLTRYGTILDLG